MNSKEIRVFTNCSLLRPLAAPLVDLLIEISDRKEFAQGERIFSRGDKGDHLYCVLSGRVRIDLSSSSGQELCIQYACPGDWFGEIAVLDRRIRTAGAVAEVATVMAAICGTKLRPLQQTEPQLARCMQGLLIGRILRATNAMHELALMPLTARMARQLLTLIAQQGSQSNDPVELHITQSDLARVVGTSRKSINGQLRMWEDQKLIDITRARIVIRDSDALGELACLLEFPSDFN